MAINLIKEIGFKHNNDFNNKIIINENDYKNVHNYILKNWNIFEYILLFNKDKKIFKIFFNKYTIKKINIYIRIINKLIKRHQTRKNNKVIIKYMLKKII
jgi:hypothetical protein